MNKKVIKVFGSIKKNDLLEDRREYSIECFMTAYGFNYDDARDLYNMVQGEFVSMKEIPADVIKEYFEESIHGGWDGFDETQQAAISILLADIQIYFEASKEVA